MPCSGVLSKCSPTTNSAMPPSSSAAATARDLRAGLPDLEDERGRGFFLLMQMVDELRVDRTADGSGLLFIAVKSYVVPG